LRPTRRCASIFRDSEKFLQVQRCCLEAAARRMQ
jgi:hypothetical protein